MVLGFISRKLNMKEIRGTEIPVIMLDEVAQMGSAEEVLATVFPKEEVEDALVVESLDEVISYRIVQRTPPVQWLNREQRRRLAKMSGKLKGGTKFEPHKIKNPEAKSE